MRRVVISFFGLMLVLAACASPASSGPQIHVESAWVRPAMAGNSSTLPADQAMAGMAASSTPAGQAMTDMAGSATPAAGDMSGMAGDGATSAVYFIIKNDGNEADTLVGASSTVASQAEVHQTLIQNDIAEMVPVPSLDIPAHGQVEFKPGGYHVMLVGLTQDLTVGQTIQVTLQFEKSGAITIDVPVQTGN